MKNKQFVIWVTNECNLRCSYCYEGPKKSHVFMNNDMGEKVIDYILSDIEKEKIKSCYVVIHGGEPTLNIDVIKKIVARLREYNNAMFTFGITTNGYSLSDSTLEFLLNNIDEITVSVDGNDVMHNLSRRLHDGSPTYHEALKTALLLNEKKNIRIRMTIDSFNYIHLVDGIVSLMDHGFKTIVPGIDLGDKRFTEDHFKQIFNAFKKIREIRDTSYNDVSIAFLNKEEIKKKGRCSGGKSNININADGKLYPCTYVVGDEDYCIGDVSLGIDVSRLSALDTNNDRYISACEGCNLSDYCSAHRCKYINKKLEGAWDNPPGVVCAMERLRFRLNC